MRELTYIEALREAMAEEMRRDPRVIILGEDVEDPHGGAFRAYKGLSSEFGCERVRSCPISEAAFTGLGVGAALAGLRPIIDINAIDFTTLTMDQMVNHAAKLRYMTGGQLTVPLVLSTRSGGYLSLGAHHEQSLEAWFTHVPGLVVVMPSSPYDGKALMKAAIRDDNPVVFIGHMAMHNTKEPIPDDDILIPLGEAEVKRPGQDLTIVATSLMVGKALTAAEHLSAEGIEMEVVDPRTLVPLDKQTILASVRKTGRLVVAHQAVKTGGFGAEIVAIVTNEAFDYLDSPPVRIAAKNVPVPFAPEMERYVLPDVDDIVRAAKELCE